MAFRAAALALSLALPVMAWGIEGSLPSTESIAARLAIPETRRDTLLDLAVMARLQQRLRAGESGFDAETLAQDRAWLERLLEQFGPIQPRGMALDPAAWWVYVKLLRQDLAPTPSVAPGELSLDGALQRVFRLDDQRFAAAVLPALLWRLEAEATPLWSRLLDQAASDPNLQTALSQGVQDWFQAAPLPEHLALEVAGSGLDAAGPVLAALAQEAVQQGPPDSARLSALRYGLLAGLPGLAEGERRVAIAYARIATLIDGLHEQRYTDFAVGLQAVVGELLIHAGDEARPVATWLARHLPEISGAYAREFAQIDPRINSSLAAAYDIAQSLSGELASAPAAVSGQGAANSAAQLALLMPDIDFYFGLPVRDTIVGTVDACTGQLARPAGGDRPALTRDLFDDCLESLVTLADSEGRSAGLSGDPGGPFGASELQRELAVTPGQRINYALGYLHERYSTACAPPARPLPNPLEWSALATLLAWYAEQSPVFFQTPENESRLARMRAIGEELLGGLAGQVDCFSGSGASLNDPVSRSLADYRAALFELGRALRESVRSHRAQVLAPGADLRLDGGADQSTTYRPEDVLIGPCDPERVCEMSGQLSSTRALLGLFPEPYLLADQSGMGEISLCYENMEWVQRRSELVRPDDDNVANYYGRFAFDLRGRFISNNSSVDVFGFRFTSPDHYHYLFAAASDEVLADSCPTEWIGSRIVTPLREARAGIVPNRLTYLAAARMLPSRLLSMNWDRGAEWRDWFITGIGVRRLEPETPPDIGPQLNQHLQAMYRMEQTAIYHELFRSEGPGGELEALVRLERLSTQKALIRMLIVLFYPQALLDSDVVRSAVAGQGGLVDRSVLDRFRQDNQPVNGIAETGLQRLEALESEWRRLPEASLRLGSIAQGVAQAAMRLERLYQSYFAAPPAAASAPPVSSPPADG